MQTYQPMLQGLSHILYAQLPQNLLLSGMETICEIVNGVVVSIACIMGHIWCQRVEIPKTLLEHIGSPCKRQIFLYHKENRWWPQ
jgi:hypothetical protein